jgi:CheY-like chemotaxis protein
LDIVLEPRRSLATPTKEAAPALPVWPSRPEGATFAVMATILLVGVDLFFRGKLEGLLAGHHLITVDSVDPPDCVICDIARIEPDDVAEAYPDIPILGFTNHTDTAGLRRAHTAGFDQVVVKAALDERAKELVDELIAPVD